MRCVALVAPCDKPTPVMPQVTVYLPTRGRPALLERAVRSALAQDYPSLQLFVVVDGPDPASEAVLARFASDARLSVLTRPRCGGAPRARNDAIDRAAGELITGLDDDDEFLPGHVSGLVRALAESSSSFACTTNVLRRARGEIVRHAKVGTIELAAIKRQNVVGNQVLTRTEFLRELGGFDPQMPAWQDYDLWLRLCQRFGPGVRIDARSYIQHVEHESERISNPERIVAAHQRFCEKHATVLESDDLLSLELLMYATSHQPFPVKRLGAYIRAGLISRASAALVSDRLPKLRAPLRWLQSRSSGVSRRFRG